MQMYILTYMQVMINSPSNPSSPINMVDAEGGGAATPTSSSSPRPRLLVQAPDYSLDDYSFDETARKREDITLEQLYKTQQEIISNMTELHTSSRVAIQRVAETMDKFHLVQD